MIYQLTYYNSGIGTHVKHSTGWRSWISLAALKQKWANAKDLAVASYVYMIQQISEANSNLLQEF